MATNHSTDLSQDLHMISLHTSQAFYVCDMVCCLPVCLLVYLGVCLDLHVAMTMMQRQGSNVSHEAAPGSVGRQRAAIRRQITNRTADMRSAHATKATKILGFNELLPVSPTCKKLATYFPLPKPSLRQSL